MYSSLSVRGSGSSRKMSGTPALMELPEDLLIRVLQNVHPQDLKVIGAILCTNKRLGSLLQRELQYSGIVTIRKVLQSDVEP